MMVLTHTFLCLEKERERDRLMTNGEGNRKEDDEKNSTRREKRTLIEQTRRVINHSQWQLREEHETKTKRNKFPSWTQFLFQVFSLTSRDIIFRPNNLIHLSSSLSSTLSWIGYTCEDRMGCRESCTGKDHTTSQDRDKTSAIRDEIEQRSYWTREERSHKSDRSPGDRHAFSQQILLPIYPPISSFKVKRATFRMESPYSKDSVTQSLSSIVCVWYWITLYVCFQISAFKAFRSDHWFSHLAKIPLTSEVNSDPLVLIKVLHLCLVSSFPLILRQSLSSKKNVCRRERQKPRKSNQEAQWDDMRQWLVFRFFLALQQRRFLHCFLIILTSVWVR